MKKKETPRSFWLQAALMLLLGVAIVLVLQNFFPDRTGQPPVQTSYPAPTQPAATSLSSPYTPPTENSPQEESSLDEAAPVPPLCVFDAGPASPEEIVPLDSYQFSTPRVVFTSETFIEFARWLPDNERLLILQRTQDGPNLIATYNLRTTEMQVYAEQYGGVMPVWLDELQAVAYTTVQNRRSNLWISYGDPQTAVQIAPDVDSASSDGTDLIYFAAATGDRPQVRRAQTQAVQTLGLDLAEWWAPKLFNEANMPLASHRFQPAWQPGGNLVAFFGDAWLFFYDLSSGHLCQVDLGKKNGTPVSILGSQWSPDGRYFAMRTSAFDPGELPYFSDLVVLDTHTGELVPLDVESDYVYHFAWSPDSQMIMAEGQVGETDQGRTVTGLFLASVSERASKQVLPDQILDFGAISEMTLGWSPDHRAIAIKCIPPDEPFMRRLCIVDVSQ